MRFNKNLNGDRLTRALPVFKICTKCGERKSEDHFPQGKTTRGGRCKRCENRAPANMKKAGAYYDTAAKVAKYET